MYGGSIANFYLTASGNVQIISNGSVIRTYTNPNGTEVNIRVESLLGTITILGDIKHFSPKTQSYNNTLTHVLRWDNIKWSTMNGMFSDVFIDYTLTLPDKAPDLSEVKDMSYMFKGTKLQ